MNCLYLGIVLASLLTVCHASTYGFNGTSAQWEGYSSEALLLHDIIANLTYDETTRLSRPVLVAEELLTIHFGIRVKQILAFDAKDQILTLFAWKTQWWVNDHIRWNATTYDGKTTALVKSDLIWLPDIILLNAVSTELTADGNLDKLEVDHNGGCTDSLPYIYRIPCPVNMHNFPFDIQHCKIRFGSWMYSGTELDIESYFGTGTNFLHIADHVPNQEWLIVNAVSEIQDTDRGTNSYKEIDMTLSLKRFAGFYFQFVLIPTLLLATLILTIFWIPPSRPDRTGLGMSVFAGLMLLLLMVVQISPPSTNVKIGTYYCVNIVLVVFSTVLSASVVAISQKNKPMSITLRKFFVQKLGRFLLISQQYEVMYPADDPSDPKQTAIRDWQILAVVLDRVFFCVYLLTVVISVSLYFPFPEKENYD